MTQQSARRRGEVNEIVQELLAEYTAGILIEHAVARVTSLLGFHNDHQAMVEDALRQLATYDKRRSRYVSKA
jgi:hypothetical protein